MLSMGLGLEVQQCLLGEWDSSLCLILYFVPFRDGWVLPIAAKWRIIAENLYLVIVLMYYV